MEILEFARALEIRAEKTYRDCAATADQPALKSVFTLLAKAEQRHQEIIREWEEKPHIPIQVTAATILGEARAHFEKLLPDKKALRSARSKLEVYLEARRQEDAAEIFYREKAAETSDSRLKEFLSALAAEEHQHFLVLDWLVGLLENPDANLENAEFNRHQTPG